MRRSCVHVYVHFVWRTWDSADLIDAGWEKRLHACIAESARDIGCNAARVGGTENHIHVLVRMSATVSVAQVAKQMKGESSHFVTHMLRSSVGSGRDVRPSIGSANRGVYSTVAFNPAVGNVLRHLAAGIDRVRPEQSVSIEL